MRATRHSIEAWASSSQRVIAYVFNIPSRAADFSLSTVHSCSGAGSLLRRIRKRSRHRVLLSCAYHWRYDLNFSNRDKSAFSNFCAGVCAQLCGSLAWVPMDVVKERLQIEGQMKTNEVYSGSFNALRQIIKHEGVSGSMSCLFHHLSLLSIYNSCIVHK